MTGGLEVALTNFAKANSFKTQGPLCVALVVTDHAIKMGLPLSHDALITERGGQVLGLGKAGVQAVLKRHGIERILAAEGGRTSRGSIGNMRAYVDFLNDASKSQGFDLTEVEKFWVARVNEFFAGKPFKVRMDAARGLRSLVRDILLQAEDRRKKAPGTQYTGAVMQHLVGAKLDCALKDIEIAHNSYSTSDSQTGRAGDFLIGDAAIHVTVTPTEALLARCQDNLAEGLRPIIVTSDKGVTVAEALSENATIGDRVDVFEVEQFIALNMYELGSFASDGGRVAVMDIVARYNQIVDEFETDPSLKIEVAARG